MQRDNATRGLLPRDKEQANKHRVNSTLLLNLSLVALYYPLYSNRQSLLPRHDGCDSSVAAVTADNQL